MLVLYAQLEHGDWPPAPLISSLARPYLYCRRDLPQTSAYMRRLPSSCARSQSAQWRSVSPRVVAAYRAAAAHTAISKPLLALSPVTSPARCCGLATCWPAQGLLRHLPTSA